MALPFWIYQLTGSAMATGAMFAALTLPQLLLSPIAGVFVDRWDRRRTMIIADLLRSLIMLAYFSVQSRDQAWVIYVIALAESSVSRFFQPAVAAAVPMIAPRERLVQVNAALGLSYAVAQLGGPALGGMLFAVWGPHSAAAFDFASYLLSACALALMRIPAPVSPPSAGGGLIGDIESVWKQLKEGLLVVASRPVLRVVFGSVGIFTLSQGVINVLLVVVVSRVWCGGASELGWLVSAQGVGALVGIAIVGSLSSRISSRTLIVSAGAGLGVLVFAAVNQASVYVAMALLVGCGILVVAIDVGWTTLIQLGSDDHNRGRVAALLQTVMALGMMISIVITGVLTDRIGAVVMLDAAAFAMIAGGIAALMAPDVAGSRAPEQIPRIAE